MGAGAPVHPRGLKKRTGGKETDVYTDMHSHVIWGVDDGAETREETFRMLREAAADNIRHILCTPHITPGVYEFPQKTFEEHFREAENYIQKQNLPLSLHRGGEILYTDNTPRMIREGKVPALAGTNLLLVEFSPTDTKEHITNALQKISGTGMIPVIAHMERYPALKKTAEVRELKERFHAKVQINARSLLHRQPLFRRGYFDSLFKENLVDFIATDTHALPGRGTCMTEGMKALEQRYGTETAERIRRNAEALAT